VRRLAGRPAGVETGAGSEQDGSSVLLLLALAGKLTDTPVDVWHALQTELANMRIANS